MAIIDNTDVSSFFMNPSAYSQVKSDGKSNKGKAIRKNNKNSFSRLFDEFRAKSNTSGLGADEKSLAFRVTLQDTGGTLQDETVDTAIKSLVDRLARVYGARLRG